MHTGLKDEKEVVRCPIIMHAFCIGELCSGRVSMKLLPYYTFLENILVEGKARNKHRPVNEAKSSYNCPKMEQSDFTMH